MSQLQHLPSPYLLGIKTKIKMNIILFFSILISLNSLSAENKLSTKNVDKINNVLVDYFRNVDDKNPDGMLEHLTSEFFLHFGSSKVQSIQSELEFKQIFNNWEKSEKSNFKSTQIETIGIEYTGMFKNYTAVANVVYSRKDEFGNILRTERALYHFILGKGYYGSIPKFIWSIATKWTRKWKIYMISNIELD